MNFSIQANEQSYQSIYINPKAQNWQEVIVCHDPIFEDEIPGVIALKSLRLENCLGFVLGAPKNRIRYFREKVKELDTNESLGKQKPRDILKRLIALADEIGGNIVYIQNETIEGPKEDIPGTPGPEKKKKEVKRKRSEKSKQREEMDSFFDPLTKRELVTKGPQYFDPSLPTMEDSLKEEANRTVSFLSNTKQTLLSPSLKVYPDNINRSNLSLWDKVFNSNDAFDIEDNKDRWNYVKAKYENLCSKLEVPPYKTKNLNSWTEVLIDLLKASKTSTSYLQNINEHLTQNELSSNVPIRARFKDVIVHEDCFYMVSEIKLPLKQIQNTKITANATNILNCICNDFDFKYALVGELKNIIKQLDDRTCITITDQNDGKCILAQISYRLPIDDAKMMFPTSNKDKLRFGLINKYKNFNKGYALC